LTATNPATTRTAEEEQLRLGTIYGFLAYGMWGILPIYFRALEPASAWEILAHRIVWSFFFCAIIWTWRRDLSWLKPILRSPRRLLLLSLAAFVLAINWGVFIWAVSVGNVVESSLGYFINPLFLVLMGVLLLGERMNRYQWTAIGFGTLAVIVISADYGRLPYVALSLATSFSIYGLIKKRVGGHIGALESMTIESAVLAPFAAAAIIWIQITGEGTFLTEGPSHTALIMASGIATAVPLILFGAAASRIPLTTMGLLQFIAPVGQFIVGVFVFGEIVPGARWAGFALVWVALVIMTIDMFRRTHRSRQDRRAAARATP